MSNILLIAVADIRPNIQNISGLEERLTAACKQARKFWMTGDETLRLQAALAATMLETVDPDERRRLEISSQILWKTEATLMFISAGVTPPDLLSFPDDVEPLPIVKIWRETK